MTRDMTKRQFDEACRRHGFKPEGFLGYHDLGDGLSVSVLNAGDNRRARLAYLVRESGRHQARKRAFKAQFQTSQTQPSHPSDKPDQSDPA